jgi:hypothetical protein
VQSVLIRSLGALWVSGTGGKTVLELGMPELVDRACLVENAALMGVGKELH